MISAFGVDHDQTVAKAALVEAYHAGRRGRAAYDVLRQAGKVTGPALRSERSALARAPEEASRGERAAQHLGFHRNAYLVGAGAAKETAAVGAGYAAWQQRKKRKAMGQPAPIAPVVADLAKAWTQAGGDKPTGRYGPPEPFGQMLSYSPKQAAKWRASGYRVNEATDKSGRLSYGRSGVYPNVERRSGLLRRKRSSADPTHLRYEMRDQA